MFVGGDLGGERAFADLARSEDRDRAAVGQRIHHIAAEVTIEQALGHGRTVPIGPGGL